MIAIQGGGDVKQDSKSGFTFRFVKDWVEMIQECKWIVFERFEPGGDDELNGFGMGGGTTVNVVNGIV